MTRLRSTENLLLPAIAARETGHIDEFRAAVESARELGADVSLLGLQIPGRNPPPQGGKGKRR